jgi:hypothetical protein
MSGRTQDSTNAHPAAAPAALPEPTGPDDDRFVYHLTAAGKQILAEHQTTDGPLFEPAAPLAEVREAVDAESRRRRRTHLHRRACDRGRRFGTISSLWKGKKRRPTLRLTGDWLGEAGFAEGRHFEIAVEDGRLVIEAV